MSGVEGQVALVTGAGSGIGRALAEALAREGARVAATDVDLASATVVADAIVGTGGQATAFALDVTDGERWTGIVHDVARAMGPIDLLCSNAGSLGCRKPLIDTPVAFARWLFEVNVLGALRGVQAVVPGMKARGRGRVLFTGSMAGLFSSAGAGDYCATKHALVALADALRQETRDDGIAVSILCPAVVATNLVETTRGRASAGAGIALDPSDPIGGETWTAAAAATGGVLSAEAVALAALAGLRSGSFFTFPHARSADRVLQRTADLLNGSSGVA